MENKNIFIELIEEKCMDFIKEHKIDQDEDYSFSIGIIEDMEDDNEDMNGDVFLELNWRYVDQDIIEEFYEYVYELIGDVEITHDEQHGSGDAYWQLSFKC